MKRLLPDIFSMMFVINKTVHKYETRQENMLHVPVGKIVIIIIIIIIIIITATTANTTVIGIISSLLLIL